MDGGERYRYLVDEWEATHTDELDSWDAYWNSLTALQQQVELARMDRHVEHAAAMDRAWQHEQRAAWINYTIALLIVGLAAKVLLVIGLVIRRRRQRSRDEQDDCVIGGCH